jgi:hypothetical protein
MQARHNVPASIRPRASIDYAVREDRQLRYTFEAYHKILDYHVTEILLSTIALAAIAFLRFHLHH